MGATFSKETVAGNIRAQRAKLRLTQEQLAEASGVHVQSIKSYENAVNVMSFENAACIAEALGIRTDDLLI